MTKKIPVTQGKFALVDDEDYERLSQRKWCVFKDGYVRSEKYAPRKWVWMHREIMNTPPGMMTDHISHDKLDNRKVNLRICTNADNQHNAALRKDNTSGYKGVYFAKREKKWCANIRVNGKNPKFLGLFDNPIDAARAYDDAAKKFFGDFAMTNF